MKKDFTKRHLPFKQARLIALKASRIHGINTEAKWLRAKKYHYDRPYNVPHSPHIIYKNKGWISWGHWLGTNNIRGKLTKYKVDLTFFKQWNSNMAYVFGFWLADGYIRKRVGRRGYGFSYGFGICQQTKDKYILETIIKSMNCNNPIYVPKSRPNMAHFEIISKEIYDDIVKLGGKQRKSLTIKFPNVPNKYIPDFVRGVFDGDGSISLNKSNYSVTCYICSGSYSFLSVLKKKLKELYDINGKLFYSDTCYRLYFPIKDVIKLWHVMYNNDCEIFLKRKYNMFKDLATYREKKYGI